METYQRIILFSFLDALVHPAFHAGFSNSVIEAIQSDSNVIVGNIGDTTNLFEKNQLILSFALIVFIKVYLFILICQKSREITILKSQKFVGYYNKKTINDWMIQLSNVKISFLPSIDYGGAEINLKRIGNS